MLKILVIDDHLLFVEGLCHILNSMIDKLTVIEASCGKKGLVVVDHHDDLDLDLDLVLLDLNLPDVSGLVVLEKLRENHPSLPVVILSASDNQGEMCQSLTLGASGFVHKSTKGVVLLHIIKLVLSGETYIPPVLISKLSSIVGHIVGHMKLGQTVTQFGRKNEFGLSKFALKLTLRQKEILGYIVSGFSNKEIASELCISESTVKSHVASVLKVLNVSNRTKAAQAVLKIQ